MKNISYFCFSRSRWRGCQAHLKNLFSKGQVWGFRYVRLEGDEMTVQVLTTPADFSEQPVLEAECTFPRRTKK